MSEPRELIGEKWLELEAERPSDERALRVAQLPVKATDGPLALAVDRGGNRHLLLPVTSHQAVRGGLDGPVLVLRKRPLEDSEHYQHFADLGCLSPDLNDVFTTLCSDVLTEVDDHQDNPLKALYRVIDRWKALFRSAGAPLDSDQVAGLYGELLILTRLLEVDASAHRLWKGPFGAEHDFTSTHTAVEVKTSSGTTQRRVRIHGLDQLLAPENGKLALAWLRLDRTSTEGEDLPALVQLALRRCDDESALLTSLASVGYHPSDNPHYRDVRFVVNEERWYAVDDAFPKLTRDQLTHPADRISDVAYTIDLSGEMSSPLDSTSVAGYLEDLIREHP